jgi:Calcium-activated BK potassium channel alpha subunit/Ion channel
MSIGTIFALLFISTGIVNALDKTEYFTISLPTGSTTLTFDDTFYYMVITIFTIGYGDFYPVTTLGRAIIGLFIIITIIIMSQQTTKLGELVKNTSPYRAAYKTSPGKHIIISGSFSGITLLRFLKELYHNDHNIKMKSCKVLIVNDKFPSKEILGILKHAMYQQVVDYLEGDLIDEKILKKSAVSASKGVFILTDQYMDEIGPADTYAVLVSSAVKDYSPKTPVFLQLVRPNLLIHNYWAGWDAGFSAWELKLSLLAANVFTSGFSTMVCNLIVSSSGDIKKVALNNHWLNEYIMGLSNEIYLVPFPPQTIGVEFSDIAQILYLNHNSLLIGVHTLVFDKEISEKVQEILLNPVRYCISPGDNAFIISTDIKKAKLINNINLDKNLNAEDLYDTTVNFKLLKTPMPKHSTKKDLKSEHLLMWETDLRGLIWDHILVFGRIEHLEIILDSFNKMTSQAICYVTGHSPPLLWNRIKMKHKEVLYLQCNLSNIKELSHTAINSAYHVILLSSKISESFIEDSEILPLISIIEFHFSVEFTVELVDEVNMKYLKNKPGPGLETLPFLTWPSYASSNVFCSSMLDYITAGAYHNNFLIDVVRRMIIYEDLYSEIAIDENCRMNNIEIPKELHGKLVFKDVFIYLLQLQRPVLALAIYRGVGILNNEIPYVYTKPDPITPLFTGDKIIVMGELNDRSNSAYLKDAKKKQIKENTIKLSRTKSLTKTSQTLLVRQNTLADIAVKTVEKDEKNEGNILPDEELLNMVKNLLDKTKHEREISAKQNEILLNLAGEYSTVMNLINGVDSSASLESEASIDDN